MKTNSIAEYIKQEVDKKMYIQNLCMIISKIIF